MKSYETDYSLFRYTNYFIFPALFPFAIGVWLYNKRYSSFITARVGCLLWVVGIALHTLEGFWLFQKYNIAFRHDYMFSTFIMGAGAFIWGLSDPCFLKNRFLVKLGSFSLGIYVLQELVAGRLAFVYRVLNVPASLGQLLAPVFIVFLSIIVTLIFRMWAPAKKIIT